MDAASALPRVLHVSVAELAPIWERHADQIMNVVSAALQETPPELCRDILEDGISLTGGDALDASLAGLLEARTGIRTRVPPAPLHAVSEGLGRTLNARSG